jgi:membrane associated rhomboid family serine protease
MGNDPEQVRRWALVLDSQGIPYQLSRSADGQMTLIVDQAHAPAAGAALRAYADENSDDLVEASVEVADRTRATARRPGDSSRAAAGAGGRADYAPVVTGLATAALLLVFFGVTGEFSMFSTWFSAGAASGELIRQGELWRTVTALTLHADIGHILSNTVSWALFVTAVMITVGSGVGLWLVLLAGAGGNLINASLRGTEYLGVGASTAVFGAVGVLAGYQIVARREGARRSRVWTPLIAGVLLFVMLGTGEHTDILAHLLGLIVGIGFGAGAGRLLPDKPSAAWQLVLTAAAVAAVAACWWLALERGSYGL